MHDPSTRLTRWLVGTAIAVPLLVGLALVLLPGGVPVPVLASPVSHFPAANLALEQRSLGPEPGYCPQITAVKMVDLDRDGLVDVLVSDAQRNRVLWYRQTSRERWEEIPLGDEINCPAGVSVADLDADGDLDVIVAVLGSVYPSDDRLGQVVLLENQDGKFVNRVLLDHVRRVSDVQAGDLDGDGDPDLSVAVFGYHHGEILWLENRGGGRFRDHLLFTTQGPSHVPLADLDGDGDLDLVALVSQDHEEIWMFENRGNGDLQPRRLHRFTNFDLGSASLTVGDLDRDGKPDLLLSAGDNLEINNHYPQPWHGVYWLRNTGDATFEPHHLAGVGGVYAATLADLDGDGDTDVVAACMFNAWRTPGAASLVLLENDGRQQFTAKMLAAEPIHLATVEAGDLNGDGRPDLVAGCLFLSDPPNRVGRVTLWLGRKERQP